MDNRADIEREVLHQDIMMHSTFGNELFVKAEPRPHQVQALADIKKTLATHDRATAVMASGTGETLVALWAAEQEVPKTALVLVPSLVMLQQTLHEWSKHSRDPFRYLAVCSDPSVDLEDQAIKDFPLLPMPPLLGNFCNTEHRR
jgi:predicted helicase